MLLDLVINNAPQYYEASIGVVAIVAVSAAVVAGGTTAVVSGHRKRKARDEKEAIQQEIDDFLDTRQPVIDNSEDIRALADSVTNPYANLGVATQAAEFQAEQADMALSSTLDAMTASGASAGGATALARAALQSQRGISASIQQQESQNAKLAAQGDAQMQTQKRNILIQAEQEEINAYNRQERRDDIILGMKRQDEQFQANLEQQYAQAELEATEQTIMAVGDAAGTIATGGAGMANPSLGGAAANSFA
tara:strand:- start:1869 stop:2621 length:753 start_codon:yes stop_codon:yes gene_type:complete